MEGRTPKVQDEFPFSCVTKSVLCVGYGRDNSVFYSQQRYNVHLSSKHPDGLWGPIKVPFSVIQNFLPPD